MTLTSPSQLSSINRFPGEENWHNSSHLHYRYRGLTGYHFCTSKSVFITPTNYRRFQFLKYSCKDSRKLDKDKKRTWDEYLGLTNQVSSERSANAPTLQAKALAAASVLRSQNIESLQSKTPSMSFTGVLFLWEYFHRSCGFTVAQWKKWPYSFWCNWSFFSGRISQFASVSG